MTARCNVYAALGLVSGWDTEVGVWVSELPLPNDSPPVIDLGEWSLSRVVFVDPGQGQYINGRAN